MATAVVAPEAIRPEVRRFALRLDDRPLPDALAVLGDERGKAALNLAKLVLIDMVREAKDVQCISPGLSLQGSTTAIFY